MMMPTQEIILWEKEKQPGNIHLKILTSLIKQIKLWWFENRSKQYFIGKGLVFMS